MSIVDNLKLIVNAQKGKDVRQAIHDGIQQCYADGKSGVIDLEARTLLEEKASVDDSNIKTKDTYSSNKIESLIANINYKKAVLKQKYTDGLNGGSAYVSQISNIIFIDFVNCVVTRNVTNREWITYSTNIPAALYPVNKTINNATVSINAGDRTIKISTQGGNVNGSIMFLAESSDNYTDETITDIQASLANVNEFVDVINEIPLTYKRKNLLKNTAVSYVSKGITYTVNNDKSVTLNGTATEDSVLQIASNYNFGNVSCLINGCENGSSSTYFLQVHNSNYSFSVQNYKGDSPITFSENELYNARIVVKSGTIVNNVTIKPMIRLNTVVNSNYEQYIEDIQTRITALENSTDDKINIINDIPLDYKVKNIARPIKNSIGITNNLEYYINYGKVKIKAGTVSATLNFDLCVTERQLIKAGTYTVDFFIENSDVGFYGQVRKLSKTGTILGTYVDGLVFSSGKRTYTFTVPEDGYYEIHILNYTASYVLSKDITVKFMLDFGSTSAINYKPYVENAQTRILSLEADVEALKSAILAMGANV